MLKFEIILARQNTLSHLSGPVAQWITRLTTDQKIPGSNPGRFDAFQLGSTSNLALTLDLSEILTSELLAAFSLRLKCDSSQIAYAFNHYGTLPQFQFSPMVGYSQKVRMLQYGISGPDPPTSLTLPFV